MLGFDSLGRLAVGQGTDQVSSSAALIADAGLYTISGIPTAFGGNFSVGVEAYTINGQSSDVAARFTVGAGAYSAIGSAALFPDRFSAGSGLYAVNGSGIAFKSGMPSLAGDYSVIGNAIVERVSLPAPSGSYTMVGGTDFAPVAMAADGAAYAVTFGDFTLARTGGEFDQVYGGIGHYREELERQRQAARITRSTPHPIVRAFQPQFRSFPLPLDTLRSTIDFAAIAVQRSAQADAEIAARRETEQRAQHQALKQAVVARRRRQEAEVLLLAS
jgi:hypothetical protein